MRIVVVIVTVFCCAVNIFFTGCGLPHKITMKVMTPILYATTESTHKLGDAEMAKYGIPGNLILLEGLLATDPYNPDLLVLAAQGYYGYGLFFVEDENHDRARTYYLNARDYGLRLLNLNKDFRLAPQKTNEDYENAMSFFDKSDVPALFWTAISWGAWIFMSLDNVQAVSELGKVVVLMQRALELDEKYYYGGPHLFYGVYYSAVSRMLGGDTEKALAHFNFAFEISQGKMLLQKVMFAQYYAYQIMDEELFKRTLTEVLDASDDLLPEARLLNIVAKKKALYLLNKTNELF